MMSRSIRVGLISDTHGLLRPEATAFLSGCHLILHGGDIGGPVSRSSALSRSQRRVVVSGHSHQATIEQRGGVLFVNPGSSGPRRFKLPVAAGELMVSESAVAARIVDLLSGQILVESKFSFRS
jgi:uncharacterized protein